MANDTGILTVMALRRDMEILFYELGCDLSPEQRCALRDAIDTDDVHVDVDEDVARQLVEFANEYDHEDSRLKLAVQLAGERLEMRLDD
jgi:hypothetical protein